MPTKPYSIFLTTMLFNEIPTVDLSHYMNGTKEQKDAFVQELGNSFSNIGFAIIKNHTVSNELINNTYETFKSFFNLPDEVKKKYEIVELAGQRGYTSKGREHAKNRNVGDLKEFYHIGQTVTDGDPIKKEYPDNIFVEELPSLEKYGVELYNALENNGIHVLRAIAEYLDLDINYFDSKVHNGNSILRPIHYFPIENPDELPEGAVRAAEHEDINLITLLVGASADGLQVLRKDGVWISANPQPTELVINVGDMLQRLTNNRLKSTTHRVVNPPRESMHLPRHSMPFFLHPTSITDLTCIASCTSDSNPKNYADTTAGEYLNERLRELGLLKA